MIYLIGNPTRDTIRTDADAVEALGGTVLYAGLLLKKLGHEVAVVGNGDQIMHDFLVHHAIQTDCFNPAAHIIEFENAYCSGKRFQKAKAGDAIYLKDVPQAAFESEALLIGAVLQEVDVEIAAVPRAGLLMLDLQGFLRRLSAAGDVSLHFDARTERVIRNCDILKVDPEEAFVVTGTHQPDRAAQRLHRMGAPVVLITLGARGCWIYDGTKKAAIEAPRIDAVDPTGAGDVFAAAFTSQILKGTGLETAGRFATAAAALSTRSFGPEGVPTLEEIDDWVRCGWTC
jgi:sugar/nucleoside kinase (ribokinase family)